MTLFFDSSPANNPARVKPNSKAVHGPCDVTILKI